MWDALARGRGMSPRAAALLEFWFAPGMEARWFAVDPAFDRELAERFGPDLARAAKGELDHWVETPDEAVALVILLDQMPRNVFRGKPEAYALDSRALAMAEATLLRGHDRALPRIRRGFLYLPFEHSESLADQEYCVSLFERAGDDPDGLMWARRHRDVIARFGRFPHRNAVLGRETSPEEAAFLEAEGGF